MMFHKHENFPRLESIADLQRALDRIRDEISRSPVRTTPAPIFQTGAPELLVKAKRIYELRRARDAAFAPDADVFRDTSWDILLDLYIALSEHRRISVSSACIGACAPATTALRHLGELQSRGLVERAQDAVDRRRQHIRLTETSVGAMERFLGTL